MTRDLGIRMYPGEPRSGIWCDGCLTSARWELDVLTMDANGINILATATRCTRCDAR